MRKQILKRFTAILSTFTMIAGISVTALAAESDDMQLQNQW